MATPAEPSQAVPPSEAAAAPLTRRGFLKFMLAGSSTLVVGGAFGARRGGRLARDPRARRDPRLRRRRHPRRGALRAEPDPRGHRPQPRALRAAAARQGPGHRDRARDARRRGDGRRLRAHRRRSLRPARRPAVLAHRATPSTIRTMWEPARTRRGERARAARDRGGAALGRDADHAHDVGSRW